MGLSADIREQLLRSFRAELAEHIQVMTDGLLALEQRRLMADERRTVIENIFRAAHSLKGAARAIGATAIEQIGHALESVLDGLRQSAKEGDAPEAIEPGLFTACYGALDSIRAVQSAYEAGETTPPIEALQALAALAPFQGARKVGAAATSAIQRAEAQAPAASPAEAAPQVTDEAQADSAPNSAESVPGAAGGLTSRQIEAVCAGALAGIAEGVSPAGGLPGSPALPAVTAAAAVSRPAAVVLPDRPAAEGAVEAAAATTGAAAERLTHHNGDDTVRVNVEKLDALMAQLSELLVTKMRIEQRRSQIHQFQEFMGLWQKEWLNARSAHGRLARQSGDRPDRADGEGAGHSRDFTRLMEFVSASQDHLRQMGAWVSELNREYTNDSLQMTLVIDRLEEEIKRVRMLPLSTITAPFARMVRDLAQELGKEAVLEMSGTETELDKQVLEGIKDPLVHLLRNAVDHGIEAPERRAVSGKPRAGAIRLRADQQGSEVVISISDDGAGLDLEAVRRSVARRRGTPVSASETAALTESDLLEAIFQTGVSTRTVVTGISGRGVGLDVVRRNVEALNGRVEVISTPGEGAAFRLILPLRLTGSHGLLVRAGRQLFILPISAVERILNVQPADITRLEGRETILYNGRPVTLASLAAVLELPQLPNGGKNGSRGLSVVILSSAERRLAFSVDELVGEQEVVIKDLGGLLRRVGGIAGASVMGSGDVVLILNPGDLVRMALRAGQRAQPYRPAAESGELAADEAPDGSGESSSRVKRVLVVDDSITTRTLEKNILEAAGYTVQAATDGEEVLSIIATDGLPDLLISDVTMPRMNGFELTRRVKNDPQLLHIPVILVTSLESPEDKARGIEVGADAYIVKGSFDQTHLLETVEQLI